MSTTYSMLNIDFGQFDNAVLTPELTDGLKRVCERVAEDTDRMLGMPIRTNPFLPEGMFVMDGPKQMVFCGTNTGKGYVVDKDRMGFMKGPPPKFEVDPLPPFNVIARWQFPVITYRPVAYSTITTDFGQVSQKRKKVVERWRKPPHARRMDRRR